MGAASTTPYSGGSGHGREQRPREAHLPRSLHQIQHQPAVGLRCAGTEVSFASLRHLHAAQLPMRSLKFEAGRGRRKLRFGREGDGARAKMPLGVRRLDQLQTLARSVELALEIQLAPSIGSVVDFTVKMVTRRSALLVGAQ